MLAGQLEGVLLAADPEGLNRIGRSSGRVQLQRKIGIGGAEGPRLPIEASAEFSEARRRRVQVDLPSRSKALQDLGLGLDHPGQITETLDVSLGHGGDENPLGPYPVR